MVGLHCHPNAFSFICVIENVQIENDNYLNSGGDIGISFKNPFV